MLFQQVKLSLAKSKSLYKIVSPKTKSIFAEQKRSFTNINFHLVKTNFSQPKMSSPSKWKLTIIDAKLLIAKLLQATKRDKRLKYPDHKRPKLKTTKTIKWKRKRPKHTPSKTNTHAKTNHACYKPQNTFSLFPLLPQRQTNLLRITQKSFPKSIKLQHH